ncbi:MAG: hypothetical protein RBS89_02470 [Candidatus Delongbacteria bacterium]|jgi:hypothetical protein|nr:hypothetical protein [Candidatus Delongbacteria bacterium]
MEKAIKIVKKGHDDSNILYWLTLTYEQRLAELQKMREELNAIYYPDQQRFQRVCRVIKKSEKFNQFSKVPDSAVSDYLKKLSR